ncbi:MAG: lipopolysaccharide biosynthesis protein [Granulosicoccus sp.]
MIRHFRNYLSAGVVGALLGLISFPLLTRSLSVQEYGLLGLVSATVTVFVSLSKLGLQSAIIRFFSEAQRRGTENLRQLMSNMSAAAFLLAIGGTVLWVLYVYQVLPLIDDTPLLRTLFLLATALVPLKIIQSILANILQADQKSGTISTVSVLEKLFRLICLAAIIVSVGLSSERALKAIIVSELVFLLVIAYCCRSYFFAVKPRLEVAVLTPLVAYGIPAMIGELSAVLLETGDRYIIQAYLGGESLGHYAAAVNICMYLEWVLILSLQSAIIPYYIKLYEERGREQTLLFLNNAISVYVAAGVGVFCVFSVSAPRLILLLAGEKYSDGLLVIPWFTAGYVIIGAIGITGAGVFIDKKTILLVKWTGIAFIVNMLLNFATVPRYGLIAAAVATFVAMCIRSVGVWRDAGRTLPVKVPWKVAGQSIACAVPALYLGYKVNLEVAVLDVLISGASSCLLYGSLLLAVSSGLRLIVLNQIKQIWMR